MALIVAPELAKTLVLCAQDKRVKDVMTPMDKVYMVEASVRLNFEHMMDIYKSGYTRIPVYERDPQTIIGILYTKDLILVDPGAPRPAGGFQPCASRQPVQVVQRFLHQRQAHRWNEWQSQPSEPTL